MRRHWDLWRTLPARKRRPTAFEVRYKPGRKSNVSRAFLRRVINNCIREACTVASALRSIRPVDAHGKRLSDRTVSRLLPVREIRALAVAQHHLVTGRLAVAERKAAVLDRMRVLAQ